MTAPAFDFSGKVALVTGVGRPGRSATRWRSAFGHAGARIVACDVNAVGVAERVREFAAPWRRRQALRRRPDSA